MSPRRLARRGAALAAAVALAAPAAAQARDLYATDSAGNLLRIDSLFPGDILDSTPLVGLPPGVVLRGIDFRPANGRLHGVGSDNRLYTVDPGSGATAPVSVAAFDTPLSGTHLGVDFNPEVDRLRVVSEANQNLRVNPTTGAVSNVDAALNPGDPSVVGSAYTNSRLSDPPASTTLYAIDSNTNQLCVQAANPGTLDPANCRPLGVDVQNDLGFDIAGPRNDAYLITTPVGGTGATLYLVDLATGALTPVGPVGDGKLAVTGLAARLNTSDIQANVPPSVSVVRTTLRPRVNQNAAYIARALDPDGLITNVEWDTDGNGTFTDAVGFSTRIRLKAGTSLIQVRVTDDAGNRTVGRIRIRIEPRVAG